MVPVGEGPELSERPPRAADIPCLRVPAEPCGKPSWRQPRRAGQGRGPTSGSLSCLGTCTRSAGPAFARPGLTELQRGAPFWMPEVPLGWLMSALPRGSQEEERLTHGRGRARARESESHLEPARAVRAGLGAGRSSGPATRASSPPSPPPLPQNQATAPPEPRECRGAWGHHGHRESALHIESVNPHYSDSRFMNSLTTREKDP